MPDRDQQKIALITGANNGIRLETARQLARDHGHTVLMFVSASESSFMTGSIVIADGGYTAK